MNDQTPMPWGIHKGTPIGEVPAHYLLFLYNEGKTSGAVKRYIEENKNTLEMQMLNDKKGIK